jgi:heptosyltransferase-2
MNLVLFLPNWVGDVVMATPTIRAIRERFPRPTRLIGVGPAHCADVLAGTPWLDEIVTVPRSQGSWLRNWQIAARISRWGKSTAVLFSNSFRAALIARVAGASRCIGYARDWRSPLLSDPLPAPRNGRKWRPISAVDYYLKLAGAIGCGLGNVKIELATLPVDELEADRLWELAGIHPEDRVAVLNTGSAFGPSKLWPEEYFSRLAQLVANRLGMFVLVLSGPAEREAAARIVHHASHPRVMGLGQITPSIGLSKACVRRAAIMVSTDSGPRHFAAAFGVKCVALFGPTKMAWSENYNPQEVRLQRQLPCGPCQEPVCPLVHHRCMRELSVEDVYSAVAWLVQKPRLAEASYPVHSA